VLKCRAKERTAVGDAVGGGFRRHGCILGSGMARPPGMEVSAGPDVRKAVQSSEAGPRGENRVPLPELAPWP
jgi:hypothetical protein